MSMKPEEMQPEMQPEMQLKPPALKPKRFALKPRKRFPKKEIDQMLLNSKPSKRLASMPSKRFALKPIQQKLSASETMVSELKRCKSAEPPKPIILEDLPVMIQMNGQKYVKLINHQDRVVGNVREYITDQSSGNLHLTKKGIILSWKDWQSLKEMKRVNQLLHQL